MTLDPGHVLATLCHPPTELVDRCLAEPERAVDVIVPVKRANPLWQSNLHNYYAQIPIARLLVGDGGMPDDARAATMAFPRAHIVDQHDRLSLGYCIRELIEHVETEWFVYLHDDVSLPDGWFDAMARHRGDLDWFECERRKMTLVSYVDSRQNHAERPYSGSQMGRKVVFEPFLAQIDDDYLYRNEDLVLRSLVEQHGGRYGRIPDTYHWHQSLPNGGALSPDVTGVTIERFVQPEQERRTWDMQARGIIKYTVPDRKYLIWQVQHSIARLRAHHLIDAYEFIAWTGRTNPAWLPHVRAAMRRTFALRGELTVIARSLSRVARILFSGSPAAREDVDE